MTKTEFLRTKAEARKTMKQLAKLFPHAFHKDGRAKVATLTMHPPLKKEKPCPK